MRFVYLFILSSLGPVVALPVAAHNAPTTVEPVASGQLRGTVQFSDGKPADYVSVALQGTTRGTTTDERGQFQLRRLNPGSYTLVVSFVGYETQRLPVGRFFAHQG